MTKRYFLMMAAMLAATFAVGSASGQTARKAVSGKEVTGTFRMAYTGKFRGSYNEIKIQALGGGKLKVGFDLVYPYVDGTGELSANMGQMLGEASISGDEAIFRSTENSEYTGGECEIRIKFTKPGVIDVKHIGDLSPCGFGFNVSANGSYRKSSSVKPNFSEFDH